MYFHIDEAQGTIEAMNSSEDHSAECTGKVDLVVPDEFNNLETFRDEYAEQPSLVGAEGLDLEYIRGRGNSTWMDDKKPYKLKFDKKQDLFGFGKNAHWVLLANRYDNSLVRNRMTYCLGRELGMEYTPQCVPVEVVMNGEYYGSYLLCEQIRIGDSRVAIDDLEADEDSMKATELPFISGGYLLSMSPYGDEDEANIFETQKGVSMFIESPSFEDFDNDTQRQYIIAFIQATENAIFSPGFKSGDVRYTDLLDLDAAAKYWWIQEFSANGDAYGSGSTFLYKTRDKEGEDGAPGESGKLFWGPLWDFDYVAWGDLDYLFVDMPPGTGDVPLTVFQSLPIDGIVIVTSPQELVSMIVGKAVRMAETMGVQVAGLVENMAYVECPDCGKKIYLFGESGTSQVAERYGIEKTASLPVLPELAGLCDSGRIEEASEEIKSLLFGIL